MVLGHGDRGPLELGEGAGCVAVQCTGRWSAAGVELETFGGLELDTSATGVPGFRVHALRQAAASVWLAAGAHPKVVQRVLGHASAAMTMDLHGHMVDANLRQAARLVGDTRAAWRVNRR